LLDDAGSQSHEAVTSPGSLDDAGRKFLERLVPPLALWRGWGLSGAGSGQGGVLGTALVLQQLHTLHRVSRARVPQSIAVLVVHNLHIRAVLQEIQDAC
jgi:hypothetical protein